jgi:5-methylcytosine-specific restriction protein A
MSVFVLNWNPSKWQMPDEDLIDAIATTRRGREHDGPWSVLEATGLVSWGDRAYLLRQHVDRGIVAAGYFKSGVYEDKHWDGSGRVATYAAVAWTRWLPTEDRLTVESLAASVPGVAWDRLQASGAQVPPAEATTLDQMWEGHVAGLVREITAPTDKVPTSGRNHEGAAKRIEVNRYESDPRARQACIAHYGTACSVCVFDFESVYGELGDAHINIHHVLPRSELPDQYQLDPVRDLVPVCPNCHTMLHRERPALSIDELRSKLRS